MKNKVWLITGGARGIGKETALIALANGDRIAVTSRQIDNLAYLSGYPTDRVLALPLDITNSANVNNAVKEVIKKFGIIDVLINNAGYGQFGAIEELSDKNMHQQIETNVYGPLYAIRAVLPVMRKNKSGHIINLSSIAGLVSAPGLGMYNASKYALEGLSEALSAEVKPLGIHVTLIEPGGVRTDFAGISLQQPDNGLIADYNDTRGKMGKYFEQINGNQPSDPVLVAKAIVNIVSHNNPPLRLVLGADAVPRIKNKLEEVKKEMAAWEDVSLSVGYQPAGATV